MYCPEGKGLTGIGIVVSPVPRADSRLAHVRPNASTISMEAVADVTAPTTSVAWSLAGLGNTEPLKPAASERVL
jgi:hypothetical protein